VVTAPGDALLPAILSQPAATAACHSRSSRAERPRWPRGRRRAVSGRSSGPSRDLPTGPRRTAAASCSR